MNLKHSLTENLGVKLIAIVAALFIWFNASGQQEMARLWTVPLVLERIPDSLTVNGPVPANVEIRVTGTRRQLLTLGFRRLRVHIDLAGARPGRQRVSLGASNVLLPSGVDRRNVSVIAPTAVDLNLERLVTRRVQPTLTTAGKISDELSLVDGGLSVQPSWITVRGPETTIERVRTVPTKPLDLSRIRESGRREIELDYDPSLLVCEPNRVTVTVSVAAKGRRELANLPPTVLVDSDDIEAVVLPNTVSLTLEGPVSLIDSLSSGDVSVLLNMTKRPPGQYTLAPEVILPPGIDLVGMNVDSLIVRITRSARTQTP